MTVKPKKKQIPIDTSRELLTARDLAARLTISVSTVWRLSGKGSLPAPIHVGGQARWRRADIDAALTGEAA